MDPDRKICVGMIAGAHGVRGLVRLRSFTEDPEAIIDFDPITDAEGQREFVLTLKSAANDFYVAAIDGVENREAADALRGVRLYLTRDQLPQTEAGEYYEADLIGLVAQDAADAGKSYGTVWGVHNYGAGTILEIGTSKKATFMLPFNDDYAPTVDIKAGVIWVVVPDGWLDPPKKPAKAGKKAAAEGNVDE